VKFGRGETIQYYQQLYQQYSGLEFTNYEDRPIAIAGIETRLIAAFETKGGYGLFDGFFRRSLMWRRAEEETQMDRINFHNLNIPSWSWMAYKGRITYLELPFARMQWTDTNEDKIRSPWQRGAPGFIRPTERVPEYRCITAKARELVMGEELRNQFIFDKSMGTSVPSSLSCVCIGEEKQTPDCYVLLIQKVDDQEEQIYERVGVGKIPKDRIRWGKSWPVSIF